MHINKSQLVYPIYHNTSSLLHQSKIYGTVANGFKFCSSVYHLGTDLILQDIYCTQEAFQMQCCCNWGSRQSLVGGWRDGSGMLLWQVIGELDGSKSNGWQSRDALYAFVVRQPYVAEIVENSLKSSPIMFLWIPLDGIDRIIWFVLAWKHNNVHKRSAGLWKSIYLWNTVMHVNM